MDQNPQITLRKIFTTFLKIGTTGVGGGMAIVSLIKCCCVGEKKWISFDESCMALP
jgi:chromate transport protein ChrA